MFIKIVLVDYMSFIYDNVECTIETYGVGIKVFDGEKLTFKMAFVSQLIKTNLIHLQLQVERVLSICRRLDPGSLFLRNKSY